MRRERSSIVAAVAAALFVALGIRLPATPFISSAGDDPRAILGPAPVLALNVVPVALADVYVTPMNQMLVVAAPGVLLNDIDANGDPLLADLKAKAKFGVEVLAANGGFTFTPPLNWTGVDSFRYCAADQNGCSNTVTVTITVTGTAPLPTPTLPPLATPTLPPLATPTLPPPTLPPLPTPFLPLPTTTPSPGPSGTPGASSSPGPSPSPGGSSSGGGAGPIEPTAGPPSDLETRGGRAEVDLRQNTRNTGPIGDLTSSIGGVGANLAWTAPAAVLALPGLLVLVVGVIQALGGAAWLPVVRRALRGTGVTHTDRRYRYIVRIGE